MLKNILSAYKYFFFNECNAVWYRFKNDFIYNENRLEGINLEHEEVAEILTDIRFKKQQSDYCKSEYEEIIEVAGHSAIYDYIMDTKNSITGFKMLSLNQILFQYAPYLKKREKQEILTITS